MFSCIFFHDTATTEIYTLSLHDALPIFIVRDARPCRPVAPAPSAIALVASRQMFLLGLRTHTRQRAPASLLAPRDRKSTRLNSSHDNISYAVFCLQKKNPPWPTRSSAFS